MIDNRDLYIPVSTTPKRLLDYDPKRWSWNITNIGSVTVYYLRGDRGSAVSTSGVNQGIPISAGEFDGFDDADAVDELWIVAGSATQVILGVTTK